MMSRSLYTFIQSHPCISVVLFFFLQAIDREEFIELLQQPALYKYIDFSLDVRWLKNYKPSTDEIKAIIDYLNRLPELYSDIINSFSTDNRGLDALKIYRRCMQILTNSAAVVEDDE